MQASVALFHGLVDDAAMFPPGSADVGDAVSAHLRYRRSWFAPLVGPLVVRDDKLGEVSRVLREAESPPDADPVLHVSVVNTGGAGGLVALARRSLPGVRVTAVESALRDLDDLAGNARRVASAVAELDEAVVVFVEVPYAPGWERAVAAVESAGLSGKIRTGGPDPGDVPSAEQLSHQLSVLIEADLPFKATAGLHHALPTPGPTPTLPRQHGFLNLLAATSTLVENGSRAEAAGLLAQTDAATLTATVAGWSDTDAARIRRRLRGFGCCGVLDPVQELVRLGLVGEPA